MRRGRLTFISTLMCFFLLVTIHTVYRHAVKDGPSGLYTRNNTVFDPFQNLDLFVRMTSRRKVLTFLYKHVLVQSLKYFWPVDVSLVLVLDEEYEPDHAFGESMKREFPFPKTCYMGYLPLEGKDRMQIDMFFPEQCTNKTYVGYVDTDAMFTTRVTPDLLFDGNKPVVNGVYGNIEFQGPMRWSKGTMNIFGTKEVMRCMSYFPVIVKVKHIIELRKYIEKRHNGSIAKVMPHKRYSQFNVICQYLWYFHRDQYSFHVQFNKRSPPLYSPARENIERYKKLLTPEQTKPFPRCAVHYKNVAGWKRVEVYRKLLKRGLCYSGGFDLCSEKCMAFDRDALHEELFRFKPRLDWSWDKRCINAQKQHYAKMAYNADHEYSSIVIKACAEIDHLQLKWD